MVELNALPVAADHKIVTVMVAKKVDAPKDAVTVAVIAAVVHQAMLTRMIASAKRPLREVLKKRSVRLRRQSVTIAQYL